MATKRQALRAKRQRQKRVSQLLWIGLGVVALVALGYVLYVALRPPTGEAVAIMADTGHVPEGADPGPYNSDPPTSGRHYDNEYDAGFYNESDVKDPYPEGFLVHNLEHGYVIFWYNCAQLDEAACNNLKSQIQSVMADANNLKVIGYPRDSIDVPVVMTSWGRMQRFSNFNPSQALAFVENNRNKAPEPNAP